MPRAIILLLPALLLTSCSDGERDHKAPEQAKRLVIPAPSAALREAPKQPDGAVWNLRGDGSVAFAAPGQSPLLLIACERRGTLAARLRFTRQTRAEAGAKAFFAIEGNGHVARLKLDATRSGGPGEWQGTASAFDEAVEALKGTEAVAATLPGGGTLRWPANPLPGKLLDDCRGGLTVPSEAASASPGGDEG